MWQGWLGNMFETGWSGRWEGGPVETQNGWAIYRMQMKAVQICGPGEDSGGEEEKDTEWEGEGGGGLNFLDPAFVHFVRLPQLLGEIR